MKFLIVSVLFVSIAAKIIRNCSASSEMPPEVNFKQPKELSDPDDSDRIVGGSAVKPHSLPYQAGLFVKKDLGLSRCGGSLISQRTVLTAAYCLRGSNSTLVILGAHEIKSDEDEQQKQTVDASDYRVHPKYNRESGENNVALLILPDPVQYNEYVQPIKLATDSASDSFVGVQATVSGWGATEKVRESHDLRSVSVKVISNHVCRKSWPLYVFDGTLCIETKRGASHCGSDYGGPLTIKKNGETIQIGVVTFTGGCKLGTPAGCTRVTQYMDWIRETTHNRERVF